jgi:hypothetical protein
MLSHDTLFNYYKLNFSLVQFHKYSLTELDDMLPWEREIYVGMLIQHIKTENEKAQLQRQAAKFAS